MQLLQPPPPHQRLLDYLGLLLPRPTSPRQPRRRSLPRPRRCDDDHTVLSASRPPLTQLHWSPRREHYHSGRDAAATTTLAAAPTTAAAPVAPASFPSALSGKKLADTMDEFRVKLGAQVNRFVAQAREVDQLDRELVVQRDRALKLQLTSSKLRKGTESLSNELELILHHQDEMHAASLSSSAR